MTTIRPSSAAAVWILLSETEGKGKISRDPDDPGGTTKWGFAQRFNPDIDVTTLTEETAWERFYIRWWLKLSCPLLPPAIAYALVDAAFHQGEGTAIQQFQKAMGGVKIDGVIGPATIARARALDPRHLVMEMISYRCIRIATKAKPKYLHGFFNRTARLAMQAERLFE